MKKFITKQKNYSSQGMKLGSRISILEVSSFLGITNENLTREPVYFRT